MYSNNSSSGSESEAEPVKNNVKKKKRESVTWIQAAEIVLSKYNHPLPHKEILKMIEEADLRTIGNNSYSASLAVLNAMLNSNSKGPTPLFYKSPTGGACYGLTKNRGKNLKKELAPKTAEFKKDQRLKRKLTPPTSVTHQLKIPGQNYSPSPIRVKKPLIPPGASRSADVTRRTSGPALGTLSRDAYYEKLKQQPPQQQRRIGPTTSALVRPAPPFSRPPPGAALRVMPPKKRVKIDQDENDSDSSSQSKNDESTKKTNKSEVTLCSRREPPKPPILQTKHFGNIKSNNHIKAHRPLQQRPSRTVQQRLHSKSLPSMKKSLPISPVKRLSTGSTSSPHASTNEIKEQENKHSFFVGFKKAKKGNQGDQFKKGFKESKLDLMTPDSVLSSVNIKDLFNLKTFNLLPAAYQYQLLMLLPDCDRVIGKDGSLRLSPLSLSNGFFTRACQEYKDKLLDGDLNTDIIQRAKQEVKSFTKLDSWKVKYFELVYGESSLDTPTVEENGEETPPPNLKPVESSWVPFLKFAENSTGDFEEGLQKMQAEVKKVAEREAKEKEEEEERRKKEAIQRKNSLQLKTNQLRPSLRQSTNHRPSPIRSMSSNFNKHLSIDQEKSKKALKKAHILQRKKALDKQLRINAKTKVLDGSRPTSQHIENNKKKLKTDSANTTIPSDLTPQKATDSSLKLELSSPKNIPETVQQQQQHTDKTRSAPLDLSNSIALKKLLEQQQQETNSTNAANPSLKQTVESNNRNKNKKKPDRMSKIVHGAATFGANANNTCPCNVKAMYLCKQCGSAWHGDCINSDKICVRCS